MNGNDLTQNLSIKEQGELNTLYPEDTNKNLLCKNKN